MQCASAALSVAPAAGTRTRAAAPQAPGPTPRREGHARARLCGNMVLPPGAPRDTAQLPVSWRHRCARAACPLRPPSAWPQLAGCQECGRRACQSVNVRVMALAMASRCERFRSRSACSSLPAAVRHDTFLRRPGAPRAAGSTVRGVHPGDADRACHTHGRQGPAMQNSRRPSAPRSSAESIRNHAGAAPDKQRAMRHARCIWSSSRAWPSWAAARPGQPQTSSKHRTRWVARPRLAQLGGCAARPGVSGAPSSTRRTSSSPGSQLGSQGAAPAAAAASAAASAASRARCRASSASGSSSTSRSS